MLIRVLWETIRDYCCLSWIPGAFITVVSWRRRRRSRCYWPSDKAVVGGVWVILATPLSPGSSTTLEAIYPSAFPSSDPGSLLKRLDIPLYPAGDSGLLSEPSRPGILKLPTDQCPSFPPSRPPFFPAASGECGTGQERVTLGLLACTLQLGIDREEGRTVQQVNERLNIQCRSVTPQGLVTVVAPQ